MVQAIFCSKGGVKCPELHELRSLKSRLCIMPGMWNQFDLANLRSNHPCCNITPIVHPSLRFPFLCPHVEDGIGWICSRGCGERLPAGVDEAIEWAILC